MPYSVEYFDLQLRFAGLVAERLGLPLATAVTDYTALQVSMGLGATPEVRSETWDRYCAGLATADEATCQSARRSGLLRARPRTYAVTAWPRVVACLKGCLPLSGKPKQETDANSANEVKIRCPAFSQGRELTPRFAASARSSVSRPCRTTAGPRPKDVRSGTEARCGVRSDMTEIEATGVREVVTVQSSGEQDWREGRGRCYEGTTEGVGGNSEGAGCWRTAAWQALRR